MKNSSLKIEEIKKLDYEIQNLQAQILNLQKNKEKKCKDLFAFSKEFTIKNDLNQKDLVLLTILCEKEKCNYHENKEFNLVCRVQEKISFLPNDLIENYSENIWFFYTIKIIFPFHSLDYNTDLSDCYSFDEIENDYETFQPKKYVRSELEKISEEEFSEIIKKYDYKK